LATTDFGLHRRVKLPADEAVKDRWSLRRTRYRVTNLIDGKASNMAFPNPAQTAHPVKISS